MVTFLNELSFDDCDSELLELLPSGPLLWLELELLEEELDDPSTLLKIKPDRA